MKKIVIGFLLCLLCIPLLGMKGGTGEGVTRCLLIGCDRFVSMPSTEPAGANNVETMGTLLEDFLGEDTAIVRQVNGPGTVEAFDALAKESFREARGADTALIYLSTHGILLEEEGMALLLSDGEEEEQLTPERLKEILDGIPGKKVLILDACHSGAVIGKGADGLKNWFEDDACRVLVSSGALEDSWFWSAETDEYTGTGYFTSAMDSALRASDPEQIDPDGNGEVSLEELIGRLRAIHGQAAGNPWGQHGILLAGRG